MAVAHLAWFHFFRAGQLQGFLTSRPHLRFLSYRVPRVVAAIYWRLKRTNRGRKPRLRHCP
jgi:hypothetical protein